MRVSKIINYILHLQRVWLMEGRKLIRLYCTCDFADICHIVVCINIFNNAVTVIFDHIGQPQLEVGSVSESRACWESVLQ